jgi:hypothetical protein
MKKILVVIAILSVTLSSFNLAHGSYSKEPIKETGVSSGGLLFTELIDNLLTVDIRDVTLREVLGELSAKNGISFLFPPSVGEEKVMVRFSHYKIDEGLHKILAPYNRIFIYTKNTSDVHHPSTTRLTEVRILPRDEDKKEGKERITSSTDPKTSTSSEKTQEEVSRHEKKEPPQKKEGTESFKTLSKGMKSTNVEERMEAVKGLASVGNVNAIGSLSSALRDKNPAVREEAEKALGKIGQEIVKGSEDDENVDELPPSGEGETNLTLTKGSGSGVDLELSNDIAVRGVQFTLDGAKPSEIRTTSRTEGFFAKFNEKNGMVVLVSLSGKKISPGKGPIAEIVCDKAGSARLSNVKVTNY